MLTCKAQCIPSVWLQGEFMLYGLCLPDDSDAESFELLQSTGDYLARPSALPRSIIQMKACRDANKESPAQVLTLPHPPHCLCLKALKYGKLKLS